MNVELVVNAQSRKGKGSTKRRILAPNCFISLSFFPMPPPRSHHPPTQPNHSSSPSTSSGHNASASPDMCYEIVASLRFLSFFFYYFHTQKERTHDMPKTRASAQPSQLMMAGGTRGRRGGCSCTYVCMCVGCFKGGFRSRSYTGMGRRGGGGRWHTSKSQERKHQKRSSKQTAKAKSAHHPRTCWPAAARRRSGCRLARPRTWDPGPEIVGRPAFWFRTLD